MQKKILMTIMIVGLSCTLLACGKESETETTVQPTTEEIVITSVETTTVEVTTTSEETTTASEETTAKKKKKKKKEEITTQAPTTKQITTQPPTTKKVEKATTKKVEKTTTKTNGKSNKNIAKKYAGKSLDSLVSAIGKYESSEKAPSCLYEGEEDGIFYWSDFSVSAHTKNGQWIIDSIN